MGKYDSLSDYFSRQTEKTITLSIKEIESIINNSLPSSAYNHVQWWSNSRTGAHPYSHSWTDSGYKTINVQHTLQSQRITFEK